MKNPDEFSFSQLRAFRQLHKTGSFSRAASSLGLSQPTVSQHVSRLERILGTPLIERNRKGLVLTSAGRVFLQHVERILALREEAARAVVAEAGAVRGTLRIGASTIPGTYILPRVLAGFLDAHPAVRTEVGILDTAATVEALRQGSVDVGIVGAKVPGSRVSFRPIIRDRVVLIASPGSKAGTKGSLSAKDLVAHPLVHREEGSGTRREFERSLQKAGVNPTELNVVCVLSSTEAVKQAVQSGLGLSYLSDRALSGNLKADGVRVVKVPKVNVQRSFFLATVHDTYEKGPARAFEEYLLSLDF